MKKLTLLIVDDNQTTVSILVNMLKGYNDVLHTAVDGMEGFMKYKKYQPDIILTDFNMPRMNGIEMVNAIRHINEKVKIILFTDFKERDILIKAIALGVNQFLSKPFENDTFLKVVGECRDEVIEEKEKLEESRKRHTITEAMNAMAHDFLQNPRWIKSVESHLRNIKVIGDISSIFLYQNSDETSLNHSQNILFLHNNPHLAPPKTIDYQAPSFSLFKQKLENNKPYYYETSLGTKNPFNDLKMMTFLLLPIVVKDTWWGFLGLGQELQKEFKEYEIDLFKTTASILGTAINNQNNLKALEISSAVTKHTMDGVFITDKENRIVFTNDAFTRITGYEAHEALQASPSFLDSGKDDGNSYKSLSQKLSEDGYWQGEIENRKQDGSIFIAWLTINTIKDNYGKIENFIAVFSDVTLQRKDAQNNAYFATHDALTGLSNRLVLEDRLEHAIEHSKRFDKAIAVIFIDLDNFKPINDNYGHLVGDEILKRIAYSLKQILRKEDTICRFGGDEFIVVIEEIESLKDIERITKDISEIGEYAKVIDGYEIYTTMSIGVSFYPYDANTPKTLILKSDNAMYRAKKQGKNQIAYAQPLEMYSL